MIQPTIDYYLSVVLRSAQDLVWLYTASSIDISGTIDIEAQKKIEALETRTHQFLDKTLESSYKLLDYKIHDWGLEFDVGGWHYAPANTAIIGYWQGNSY